jgi:hypothetical protein
MTMQTTRAIALPLCGLLLSVTLASAQPQPQKQPPPPPAQPQDPSSVPAPTVLKPEQKAKEPAPSGRIGRSDAKVSGCLQRAEEPGGTASEPARLVSGYILKQATVTRAKEAPGEARGESGPTGSKEYRVVAGKDSIKLADHVGHQVEVTGRISLEGQTANPAATEAGTSASRPSGSTGVSASPSTGTSSAVPQVTLSVTSLKMVASSCTTPTS